MYCSKVKSLSNGINFGAVRLVDEAKFSKAQKNVADDIQVKLGTYGNKFDFVIAPKFLSEDTVELKEVCHVEEVGTGKNKEMKYDDLSFIGSYNKDHPFNLEDYKKADKALRSNLWGAFAAAGIIMLAIMSIAFANFKAKSSLQQFEKVQTMVEDSLKTISRIK